MPTTLAPAARASLPWVIVVAGCLIALITFGPRSVLGLFLAPMTEGRGWSRETFALALAIQNILWGLGQPFAGAFADRYGAGRVLALGGLVYAGGLALMAFAPSPLWLHVSAGVMIGLGMAAGSFTIVLAALGRRVTAERRAFVFGVGTAAGSAGQFLFAPFGAALISSIGWADALLVMAALMLAVPLLAIPLRGRPTAFPEAVREQTLREALAEAFAYRGYLLLVIGFFVCGFHIAFITAHLPAYLADLGFPTIYAGWSIALIGLFNIVGSLASGVLSGRYPKNGVLALIYLARAVLIAAFVLLPATPVTVLAFSALMGLLWLSTVPPTSGLVATMFGPRYMGTLMGVVFFSHQVGAFLGVWLGGRLYDQTGSYDVVWWLGVALGVFAALVHWPIRDARAPSFQAA